MALIAAGREPLSPSPHPGNATIDNRFEEEEGSDVSMVQVQPQVQVAGMPDEEEEEEEEA